MPPAARLTAHQLHVQHEQHPWNVLKEPHKTIKGNQYQAASSAGYDRLSLGQSVKDSFAAAAVRMSDCQRTWRACQSLSYAPAMPITRT